MSLESPPPAAPEKPEVTVREMMRGNCKVTITERVPTATEDEEHDLFQDAYPGTRKVVEISITNPEGQTFNLQDLLPEGWLLTQHDAGPWRQIGPAMDGHGRTVIFPRFHFIPRISFLRQPGDLLALRGRTSESRVLDRPTLEKMLFETQDFLELRGSMLALLHEIGHVGQEYAPRSDFYRTEAANSKKGILAWDKKRIIGYLESVMVEERDAWAKALENYRDLYAKGIDVEPELELPDILEHIHTALDSYTRTDEPKYVEEAERIRRENKIEKATKETAA